MHACECFHQYLSLAGRYCLLVASLSLDRFVCGVGAGSLGATKCHAGSVGAYTKCRAAVVDIADARKEPS